MKKKLNTQKAQAYTPGLKIKKNTIVQKRRTLTTDCEVLVNLNEEVDFDTIIAKTMIERDPVVVPASDPLGLEPSELHKYIVKGIGEKVQKDEIIAKYEAFFGLIKRYVNSPIDGVIEHISENTGRITIRGQAIPLEEKAYIPGKVVNVIPSRGVLIKTNASYIQGIFGVGGENHGQIALINDSPFEEINPDNITQDYKGKILVGGSLITLEALKKAVNYGVAGIVVGGVRGLDLKDFMGYEIGVAITGDEEVGLTLIITEGFGRMAMSMNTFKLLKSANGKNASINGATQIRAGVLRPEIIIPQEREELESFDQDILSDGINPGTMVRVIREPFFGRIGTIKALPVDLHELDSGSYARVFEIELENGEKAIVPRANVEIIEE